MLIVVDVESDGPCPGLYSMVSFGAVVVEPGLNRTFFGQTAPLFGARYLPEALAACRVTRAEHLEYPPPIYAMERFDNWLAELEDEAKRAGSRLTFISDNPAYDWQFPNYYLWATVGRNRFGHSARRIGDLWCGLQRDARAAWKHLRKTKHTHHPVDDARGNAEALLIMGESIKKLI